MEELARGSWRIGQCFLLDHNRPIAVEIACVLIQRELESGNARLAMLIDKWLGGASNRLRFSLSRRTQYCWREIAPLENISQSNIPLFRWFEMSLFRNFAGTKYRLNRAIMPYSSRWEFKDRYSRWGLEPVIVPCTDDLQTTCWTTVRTQITHLGAWKKWLSMSWVIIT